jgi:hypothetical protein
MKLFSVRVFSVVVMTVCVLLSGFEPALACDDLAVCTPARRDSGTTDLDEAPQVGNQPADGQDASTTTERPSFPNVMPDYLTWFFTPKKCCACFYQDRPDTRCDLLDFDQCESYPYATEGRDGEVCGWDSANGRCFNIMQDLCDFRQMTTETDCDYYVSLPTLGGRAIDLTHKFPPTCESTHTFYAGHGNPAMCEPYLQNLQTILDSTTNRCVSITVDSIACSVFQNPSDIQAAVDKICGKLGVVCTISANQADGVAFVPSLNPDVVLDDYTRPSYETKITVCIEGVEEPSLEYPECPAADDRECDKIQQSQTQQCMQDGQLQSFTCCRVERPRPRIGRTILPPVVSYQWQLAGTCPKLGSPDGIN